MTRSGQFLKSPRLERSGARAGEAPAAPPRHLKLPLFSFGAFAVPLFLERSPRIWLPIACVASDAERDGAGDDAEGIFAYFFSRRD